MSKEEMCVRVKVAYEQLCKCHSDRCRNCSSRDDELLEQFRELLNKLLNLQVSLGMIKREEDIE